VANTNTSVRIPDLLGLVEFGWSFLSNVREGLEDPHGRTRPGWLAYFLKRTAKGERFDMLQG
jgi:hypothetical protein